MSYFGEVHNGKHVDQTLREYFPDLSYKGVFFDVGAFEPILISNSHHFHLTGWDVYAFEANTELIPLLKAHRNHVFNYAISNECRDEIQFNVVTSHNGWSAGFSAIEVSEEYKRIFGSFRSVAQIKVPMKTLNVCIEEEMPNVTSIDIMSLDVEGGELNVLKGLDLNKYPVKVFCIENVTNATDIGEYLAQFGYSLDKQILYNQYYIKK